jgi:hypothetical protein
MAGVVAVLRPLMLAPASHGVSAARRGECGVGGRRRRCREGEGKKRR